MYRFYLKSKSCDMFSPQYFRQSLEECPQLDFVKELQFLNLQHNLITKIQNLSHLQQLVLLNLHDNHISDMAGIEVLRSLKILILGKNRLVAMTGSVNKQRQHR